MEKQALSLFYRIKKEVLNQASVFQCPVHIHVDKEVYE